MKPSIIEAAQTGYLLLDGAMGTELLHRGLQIGGCSALWNVERPEDVAAVHQSYVDAGANALVTNTFVANPLRLSEYSAGEQVSEVNARAVEIARKVAGGDRWVLGSMGPCCGKAVGAGTYDHEAIYSGYVEQARPLASAGVDALLIETVTDSNELKEAIRAAREGAPGVPVIASLAMRRYPSHDQFRLIRTGESLGDCVTLLRELKLDAVGINCGADISIYDYTTALAGLRAGLVCPLLAKPNAGHAAACGDEVDCAEPAEMMAEGVWGLVRAGATMIGGCCGTTPEHIRLFREELDKL